MEIIVSDFMLDSSEKGVWEYLGRWVRKNYPFSAYFHKKEEKTFPASVIKSKN